MSSYKKDSPRLIKELGEFFYFRFLKPSFGVVNGILSETWALVIPNSAKVSRDDLT